MSAHLQFFLACLHLSIITRSQCTSLNYFTRKWTSNHIRCCLVTGWISATTLRKEALVLTDFQERLSAWSGYQVIVLSSIVPKEQAFLFHTYILFLQPISILKGPKAGIFAAFECRNLYPLAKVAHSFCVL